MRRSNSASDPLGFFGGCEVGEISACDGNSARTLAPEIPDEASNDIVCRIQKASKLLTGMARQCEALNNSLGEMAANSAHLGIGYSTLTLFQIPRGIGHSPPLPRQTPRRLNLYGPRFAMAKVSHSRVRNNVHFCTSVTRLAVRPASLPNAARSAHFCTDLESS